MQLPASASQTLYSRREAEAGSTSNYVISETSNSEMLLTAAATITASATPSCVAICAIQAVRSRSGTTARGHARICRRTDQRLPSAMDAYLANERNRQRQAIECQEQLGLRPFGSTRPLS